MSTQPLDEIHQALDRLPEWFRRLGLYQPEQCAAQLVESLTEEPFYLIGFTAIAASHCRDEFAEIVDLLAGFEPSLRVALPVVAAAMPSLAANDSLNQPTKKEIADLPRWLREIDKAECTGVMRRYDYADRRASSYLIETRLADGQVATGRLSIRHDDVDSISEFWTTGLSLGDAARFYRKRYALHATRPYRRIKPATAGRRILDAMMGSVSSGQVYGDADSPIPWPQNLAVLNLMVKPLLAEINE